MDLLDNIMGEMGKIPASKKSTQKRPSQIDSQSKRIKTEDGKSLNTSSSLGASSFRIPKRTSAPPCNGPGNDAPSSGQVSTLQLKQEYKPTVSTQNRSQPRSMAGADQHKLKPISSLEVELNALTLNTERCPPVQRYHLDILNVIREGKEKDATHCQKNDIARQRRELALFAIVRRFIFERPERFGHNPYAHCYDGGYILYSVGCNLRKDEIIEASYEIAQLNDKAVEEGFPRGMVTVEMRHTGEVFICPSDPRFHNENNLSEAVKVLNCLSSQSLHEGRHLNFLTKSFESNRDEKYLGQGKILKCGLDKNVRLMGGSLQNSSLVVQGSAKISAFYKKMPLLNFIGELLEIRGDEAIVRTLKADHRILKRVEKELRNVVVSTTHLEKNKAFYIRAIMTGSANSEFVRIDGNDLSVADYFKLYKKIKLRFPDAPLAVEIKSDQKKSLFPLELLELEKGQRVGNDKLVGDLTSNMLQEARMLPHEQKQRMIALLTDAKLKDSRNPYLEAFGIDKENQFVQAIASVITAPLIKTGNNGVCAPQNNGQMGRLFISRFARGAVVERAVHFIVFDNCMDISKANEFLRIFLEAAKKKGIILKKAVVPNKLESEETDVIDRFFEWAISEKAAMVLFVTAQKLDPVHDFMKLREAKYKLVTQHICVKTAHQIMNGRGGGATLDNVLLKFNEKLSGLNTIIEAPNNVVGAGGNGKTLTDKLFAGRMFFGIDMSHAAAQSLFDRQNEVRVREPTVVGMAYTVKENTNLAGRFWFQQPRLHKIQCMEGRLVDAIKEYYENNKILPRELIVYRGGGSEGEFDDIREEVKQIRAACRNKEIATLGRGSYSPPIMLIVAMKNSNNMIFKAQLPFPQRGPQPRAGELNVPSGTCIEGEVMNPMFEEFCLQSQIPRIGSSKPMRYVILVNDGCIPKDQVIHMTHWLAFGHQVATGPTHKPHVLFGAENLAKRGRANWQSWKNDNSEATSSGSGPHLRLEDGEDEPGYFERISKSLNNPLKGMYWA